MPRAGHRLASKAGLARFDSWAVCDKIDNGSKGSALTVVEKTCVVCGETKPLDAYKNRKNSKDGKRNDCRACTWERERKRRERPEVHARMLETQRIRRKRDYDPEVARDWNLRGKFGITHADYEAMLAQQGGSCAVCGGDNGGKHLHVDHDHTCCSGSRRSCGNCIRGLLCSGCNMGLGLLNDSLENLRAAIKYLGG